MNVMSSTFAHKPHFAASFPSAQKAAPLGGADQVVLFGRKKAEEGGKHHQRASHPVLRGAAVAGATLLAATTVAAGTEALKAEPAAADIIDEPPPAPSAECVQAQNALSTATAWTPPKDNAFWRSVKSAVIRLAQRWVNNAC